MSTKRLALVGGLLTAIAVLAGAAFVVGSGLADPNEACNSVPRRAGGCEPDQPRFTATTCDGVGQEYGDEIARRADAIIDGPESSLESKPSRVLAMTFLVTTRADQHLRGIGLGAQCDVDEFLSAAGTRFTPTFRARIGDYLYDDPDRSYTYEDWLANLRRTATMIEAD